MVIVDLVVSESLGTHVKLVCAELNEKHRRWVAAILSLEIILFVINGLAIRNFSTTR